MKFWVADRGEGKTTALLEWMRAAPEGEHRVMVCVSEQEAMRVYRSTWDEDDLPTDLESWQFVGWREVTPDAWRGVLTGRGGQVVLGIDNVEVILAMLFRFPIDVTTMSTKPEALSRPAMQTR